MIAQARLAAIKGILPSEWIIRFVFGGAVCVLAGLVSKEFGPLIGGLFLAFPSIFPASARLVETHERRHKARAGFDGKIRGRTVAGLDAAGAAIGCFGLAGFALVCWLCLPRLGVAAVFILATLAWLILSVGLWWLRKTRIFRIRRARHSLHAFRAR